MYDRGKIIIGVVIFLLLLAFPMIYLAASGDAGYVPDPVLPADEEKCVESAEYMRENHTTLLQDWREGVVRAGTRTHVASDGKQYDVSLVETCLGCHDNKAEFCDQCHNYVGAEPSCWDCHEAPEE
jgi:hypothetical protein